MGSGTYYVRGMKEPATLLGWKIWPILGLWGVSASIAGYGRFIRGYNNLWLVGGFVPLWAYLFYNWARQPEQEIQNCYNYLLAKRAATCELEANSKRFNQNEFAQTEEYRQLRQALEARNITLYQLEAELLNKINQGAIK